MNTLEYKGYVALVEVDPKAGMLVGRVLGLRDIVVFETPRADEVEKTFHETLDDYLAYCAEEDREPDKPFSGRLVFRTTPERHRGMAMAAAQAGLSLNAWLDRVVARALDGDQQSSSQGFTRQPSVRYIMAHPQYGTGDLASPSQVAEPRTETRDTAHKVAY